MFVFSPNFTIVRVNRFLADKEQQEKHAKKRIEDAKEELQRRMKLHNRARDSIYPKNTKGQSVSRTHVPDELVSFEASPSSSSSKNYRLNSSVCLSFSLQFSHSFCLSLCLSLSFFLFPSFSHFLSFFFSLCFSQLLCLISLVCMAIVFGIFLDHLLRITWRSALQ